MTDEKIPGLGVINEEFKNDFIELRTGGDGMWSIGTDGVKRILTPLDKKNRDNRI